MAGSVTPPRAGPAPQRCRVGRAPMRYLSTLLIVFLLFRSLPAASAEMQRVVLPNRVRLILKPAQEAELVAISICVRTEPDRIPLEDAAGELVARTLFSSS